MATTGPCNNGECTFNQNGACVEGQDPETCRFRDGRVMISEDTALAADDPEADATDLEIDGEISGLALRTGARLQAEECRAIRQGEATRVVSILAPKNSGKTSLVAGFYELFLEGRADGFSFAGSETLFHFEKLCHLSRGASNRTSSDMLRTRHAEGLGYYHISIDLQADRLGVLFGDRPGETVRKAGNGVAAAVDLLELRSADVVLYLMDGALFQSPATRNLPLSDAEAILESLLAADHLTHKPRLGIVLTKADLVDQTGEHSRFKVAVKALSERFGDRFDIIEPFETAANADTEGAVVGRGHGMNSLLAFLVAASPLAVAHLTPHSPPIRRYSRYGRLEALP